MKILYSAIFHNKQGAWCGECINTKAGIKRRLNEWLDPENIYVSVRDQYSKEIGYKPIGRKTFIWHPVETVTSILDNLDKINYVIEKFKVRDGVITLDNGE